ncbi:MAG: hypothetical protein HGA31_06810 [Candidatus Moranbacteria bacterium]|nr:hypothetical protein [Candidatus Moranbacteria bacterium]
MSKFSSLEITPFVRIPAGIAVGSCIGLVVETVFPQTVALICNLITCIAIFVWFDVSRVRLKLLRLNLRMGRIFPAFQILSGEKSSLPESQDTKVELLVAPSYLGADVGSLSVTLMEPLHRVPNNSEAISLIARSRSGGMLLMLANGKLFLRKLTSYEVVCLQYSWM